MKKRKCPYFFDLWPRSQDMAISSFEGQEVKYVPSSKGVKTNLSTICGPKFSSVLKVFPSAINFSGRMVAWKSYLGHYFEVKVNYVMIAYNKTLLLCIRAPNFKGYTVFVHFSIKLKLCAIFWNYHNKIIVGIDFARFMLLGLYCKSYIA